MLINCDTCAVRHIGCDDCVVTVLLGPPPAHSGPDVGSAPGPDAGAVVELDQAQRAALAVLADTGLIPPLRLLPTADRDEHWTVSEAPVRMADDRREAG